MKASKELYRRPWVRIDIQPFWGSFVLTGGGSHPVRWWKVEQIDAKVDIMTEPKQVLKVLNIRLRQDLYDLVEDLAYEVGKTKTEIVIEAIQHYARYLRGRESAELQERVAQVEDQVAEILARLSLVEANQPPDEQLHPRVIRAMLELRIRDLDKATRDELRKISSRVGIPREQYMNLNAQGLRKMVYTYSGADWTGQH